MTTSETIQAIREELRCRTGKLAIHVLVECYGESVKSVLWDMDTTGEVRLIGCGDLSKWTAAEKANSIKSGSGELFTSVEKAA